MDPSYVMEQDIKKELIDESLQCVSFKVDHIHTCIIIITRKIEDDERESNNI